jgi:hypothetical protein
MATITELLSGILRYFPNTMTITLLVLGITINRLPWILIALGGIAVSIITMFFQYLNMKFVGYGAMPGSAALQACSLIPTTSGVYTNTPSMWIAMSVFYLTYIITNAANVYGYTNKSKKAKKETAATQRRKSIGIISILAVSLLFFFIVIPRLLTSCESIVGVTLGGIIGATTGYGWWAILNACGSTIYPDIHGVMLGLDTGKSLATPLACS